MRLICDISEQALAKHIARRDAWAASMIVAWDANLPTIEGPMGRLCDTSMIEEVGDGRLRLTIESYDEETIAEWILELERIRLEN